MIKVILSVCQLVIVVNLLSCAHQTSQKPTWTIQEKPPGGYSGSISFKNLKKSGFANFEILIADLNKQRIEVVGPFSISIASIAIQQDRIEYLLHQQKIYGEAKNSRMLFKKLLGIELDHSLLAKIILRRDLTKNEGWTCDLSPAVCKNKQGNTTINWTEITVQKQTLHIEAAVSNVLTKADIIIRDSSSKVEMSDDKFHLKVPPEYKK